MRTLDCFFNQHLATLASFTLVGIPHGQQQFQILLLAAQQDGTKQGQRCVVIPTRPWTISGPLSCVFSQQNLHYQSFVGHD